LFIIFINIAIFFWMY